MLSGSPKDAIAVILRQLNDWQLAFALARVIENGTDGPLVKGILSDTVVPLAFAGGHRWLATWAFWMLGRRDLAVRVLVVSDFRPGAWIKGEIIDPLGPNERNRSRLVIT